MVIPRQGEWRSELPATLEAVEQFCAKFQQWRACVCADLNSFSSALLLRESLTNAVIHGCAEDPRKRISCVLRAKPGRLLINIRDAGEGFDWRAAWDRRPEVAETGGRGVEILRRYSNSVRFNREGNSVTLVKRFEVKNEVEVKKQR
jgi:anti-sigma regulatory factor (Ser/Thr protein kinase)